MVRGPKRLGILCPGQGAQYVGMGRDFAERYAGTRRLFDEADEALGLALSKICFEGPEELLTRTENAQPAIFMASLAAWEAFKQERDVTQVAAVCGLSAGEFTALTLAGLIEWKSALKLVRRRGELMAEASRLNPGTMASILGLNFEQCRELCRMTGAEIANVNAPAQIVIAGRAEAVTRAAELAKSAGAKRVIPLKVSGAFHSSRMEPARQGLSELLDKTDLKPMSEQVAFIANVSGQRVNELEGVREGLKQQLVSPVQWVKTVETLAHLDLDELYEIGPGTVLKGLVGRIRPDLVVYPWGRIGDLNASSIGSEQM